MSAVSYVEKLILQRIVHDALAAGFSLSVNDGEEITVKKSTDFQTILNALRTVDEDRLIFHKPGEKALSGWVFFVYGNDGWDVVNDYTVNLESFMAPIFTWITKTFEEN